MSAVRENLSRPVRAWHAADHIHVTLASGESLSFPVSLSRRLTTATAAQRGRIELLPFTLHWPDLDEDITIESIQRATL